MIFSCVSTSFEEVPFEYLLKEYMHRVFSV